MHDEPLLRDRFIDMATDFAEKNTIEEPISPGQIVHFADMLVKVFNEHAKSTAILSAREKARVQRVKNVLKYKERRMELRDEEAEQAKRESYGASYNDHLAADISALEWAVKFIDQHSV